MESQSMMMDPQDPTRRLKRLDNDYLQDRGAQKSKHPPGIWPGAEQDYCVTETMGAIYDRTKEHLYHGDAAIVRLRQMLGKAARELQEGIDPPGVNGEIALPQDSLGGHRHRPGRRPMARRYGRRRDGDPRTATAVAQGEQDKERRRICLRE